MNQSLQERQLMFRSKQKKLRSTFRAAGEASKMGYAVDLSSLCNELAAMPDPADSRKARQYVKLQMSAAEFYCNRNELDFAKDLLLNSVNLCRKFNLLSLKLKAMRKLTVVLRQQGALNDMHQCLDEAIATAKEVGKRARVKALEREMSTVNALIEHDASIRTSGGFVLLDECEVEQSKNDSFRLTPLDPAEAIGANRARMKRTDFSNQKRPYSFGPPSGRRKAVFVTTLLKKRIGPWMRFLKKLQTQSDPHEPLE